MYLTCFCVFLFNVHASYATNNSILNSESVDVTTVADLLLTLFGHDGKNDTKRIKDLKEKLAKIETYVVDRHKYTERIQNETKSYYLNATNFYLALNEKDHFRLQNDTRSLYLKLKEKMNRDDLLSILAERGGEKTKKSARRMLKTEHRPTKEKEREIDDVVDKFLGEAAHDNHKFNKDDGYSKYWDPQVELEERKAYYQPSGRRIFKGERTTIRYYPFMVSIHVMGRFWCGGVLYWSDLVITSAACLQLLHNNRFYRENPKIVGVRVGSNHSRVGGEMIDALEIYFHPSYKPKTLENNIAIIRLRRQIKMSYHRTPKLIEISHVEGGVPFTAEVLLLGWGVSKTSQKMAYEPLYLQRKMLPVYPSKYCAEVYGDKFNPRTMFCAGTVTTGEGACSHDAGGPAILAGRLVGIISYGPTICGYPDAPTVLTLVGKFADWIETVNETMPSYYRFKKRTTTTTVDPFVMYFYKYTVPFSDAKTTSESLPQLLPMFDGKEVTVHQLSVADNVPPAPPPPPEEAPSLADTTPEQELRAREGPLNLREGPLNLREGPLNLREGPLNLLIQRTRSPDQEEIPIDDASIQREREEEERDKSLSIEASSELSPKPEFGVKTYFPGMTSKNSDVTPYSSIKQKAVESDVGSDSTSSSSSSESGQSVKQKKIEPNNYEDEKPRKKHKKKNKKDINKTKKPMKLADDKDGHPKVNKQTLNNLKQLMKLLDRKSNVNNGEAKEKQDEFFK